MNNKVVYIIDFNPLSLLGGFLLPWLNLWLLLTLSYA